MNFNFDTNSLLVAVIFGSIGTGMFLYGKKQGRLVPLLVGVALIVVPFFIPGALWQTVICLALLGASYAVRERI